MKRAIIILTICALLAGGRGFAAIVDSDENGLQIQGYGMLPESEISVILINPNGNWTQIGADMAAGVVNFADVITTEPNGNYRVSIPMRPDCSAGLYQFMAGDSEETFYYAGTDDKNRAAEIIIGDISAVEDLLDDANLYFGILETESAGYKKYYSLMDHAMRGKVHTALQNYTYNGKTQTYEEKKLLFKDFDNHLRTVCETLFEEDGFTVLKPYLTVQNVMQMLLEYNNIFAVDFERVAQDDAVLAENIYHALQKEKTLTKQDLRNKCYEQAALRKINTLSSWNAGTLKDIFETYPEIFEVGVRDSGFYTLSANTQNLVMQAVADKNDYETGAEVIQEVISAIRNIGESSKPNSGSSSGGGLGGASKGNVPIVVPADNNKQEDTAQENPEQPKEIFDDIEDYSWAKESILYFARHGVVSGAGDRKFLPGNNVTREEFLKMVMRAFQITEEENENVFSDVDAEQWYAPYVNTAKKKGLINGISENEFGSGLPVTREDAAVILVRAAEYAGITIPAGNNTSDAFRDRAEIAEYAVQAVNKLFAAGVIAGKEDMRFAPAEYATRAEVSKMLYALIQKGE